MEVHLLSLIVANFTLTLLALAGPYILMMRLPGIEVLGIVMLLGLLSLLTFGIVLFTSLITVYIPDMTRVVSLLLRALWFLSPIIYDSSRILSSPRIPDGVKLIFSLNPLTPFITDIREAILQDDVFFVWQPIAYVGLVSVLLVISGLFIFRRYRNNLVKML